MNESIHAWIYLHPWGVTRVKIARILDDERQIPGGWAADPPPMDDNQRTSETERRRATILFADITGFTSLNERRDPEDAYALISSCLKFMDEIARRHGGSVDKYLGDCIMAVFGVPTALEDAPKAALNAAIEMHNQMADFSRTQAEELSIHSGINTGLVISGDISGPIVREFSIMGDAVNIAARLKDLAPAGQIWVGAETHRAILKCDKFLAVSSQYCCVYVVFCGCHMRTRRGSFSSVLPHIAVATVTGDR